MQSLDGEMRVTTPVNRRTLRESRPGCVIANGQCSNLRWRALLAADIPNWNTP